MTNQLRCKQGDLAIVITCVDPSYIGKIVTCESYVPPNAVRVVDDSILVSIICPTWKIDINLPRRLHRHFLGDVVTKNIPYADDGQLRPLRDNPGADETLAWAGLPKKQGEPA